MRGQLQPAFNPKYQIVQTAFNNLGVFKPAEHTIQLIDNNLVESLITQRPQVISVVVSPRKR
jgi:hypothetical protein